MLASLPLVALLVPSCSGEPAPSEVVEFTIPSGASFDEVTDTLVARELVGSEGLFGLFARIRGNDREIRSGRFAVEVGTKWVQLLDHLVAGPMLTEPITIPEGFTLVQIAERVASWTELDPDEVTARLTRDNAESEWNVPGPGLEGYLFPDTYNFVRGVGVATIVTAMVERYRAVWTDEWETRAEAIGLDRRKVTTLASIIQAEAVHEDEMPIISGVYHNRLRLGILLQADPTVQYALGERTSRLLFADIDAVADHPYNTYTQPGLPPGPIGAPGEAALRAALYPADVEFLYFVARPDGTHIFTRTLQEHNEARVVARREWDALEASPEPASDQGS